MTEETGPGRWSPSSRTVDEAEQWRRRIASSIAVGAVGAIGVAVARTGSVAFIVVAVGMVLGVGIGVATPWWRTIRDGKFKAERPDAAYAGAASLALDGARQSEYLRDAMAGVHWDRLGATIGPSGLANGALYVSASGVSWSPTMHAWGKGFRDWTVPWTAVAGVKLLPDRLWHHPSAFVLTLHNGERLTLRDIDPRRMQVALGELDAASPGAVPPPPS